MPNKTKRDLVAEVSQELGWTQQDVAEVVNATFDQIASHLAHGDGVILRNFGIFDLAVTKPRVGRNPKRPGNVVQIPERAVVKFRPGKELRERVASSLPVLQEQANE